MADIVLGSITQVLVETTMSLATKETNLLLGLKKDLSNMRKKLKLIQDVLRDAERQQQTKDAVKLWLERLENWAFEADDVLDEFNYESLRRKAEIGNQMKKKVAFFFSCSNPIVLRVKMAHKIQKITLSLTEIRQESKDFNLQPQPDGGVDSTTSQNKFTANRDTAFFDVSSDFVGRDDDVSKMVEDLIAKNDEIVSVIPIIGMAGIGKTTLARRLSNHPKIQQHFASSIWVCISKIEVNRLLQLIQESLRVLTTKEESTQARVNVLREQLKDRRYLLILDDVWDISEWDDFLEILKDISSSTTKGKDISSSTTLGNCILVTTRQQGVDSFVRTSSSPCSLKTLSDDECWLILKKKAFDNREVLPGLEAIGLEIAQKCQGLPLAASVLGGMLRNKGINEWLSILKSGLQISGGGDSIMGILRLSYDYLPYSALKKCFAYLSIFPKDSEMKRDDLIQLWIAEGFLHPNPGTKMEMEDIGNKFFNILLQHSLLQEEERDDYGNVLCCKMHDLVHDLALTISGSKTANMQDSRRNEDDPNFIRYLAPGDECGNEMASNMNGRFRLTRTLFLDGHIAQDILSYPMSLRVLKFSSSHLEELPDSVGKLIHLRFLDLSSTKVKDLPDFVCKLYNLQTLIVGETKLPHTLKDLVNLRYLDYSTSIHESYTPLGLGCLTFLHFLPFFNVSQEKGRKLEELRHLNYLSRSLQIYNLELVNGREEARQASLCEKPNLDELRFTWKKDRSGDNQDADVLEGLEPHKNLKGLVIENFLGNHLSPWITKLDRLMKLQLEKCKLKELPALGHLPFLSILELVDLDEVTCLCPSLSSSDTCGGSSKHSGSTSQLVKRIFPALKRLYLQRMHNLIEWVKANGMPTTGVIFFPVLEELTIERCGNLASFPNHVPSLKKLHVERVSLESSTLSKICSQASALTDLSLYRVNRNLETLPESMLFNMPNLRTLKLKNCHDLRQMWKADDDVQDSEEVEKCETLGQSRNHALHVLPSIVELYILDCANLQSIQIPNGHRCLPSLRILGIWRCERLAHISSELVKSTTSLETLTVESCPNLVYFPIDLQNLTTLSELDFCRCQNYSMPEGLSFLTRLRDLELGPFSNSTEYHSNLYLSNAFQYMSSLRFLKLWGFESWDSLPDQLQYLSDLNSLHLYGFGVKRLPDWFEKLASLRLLSLCDFKELEYLPSEQSMRRLKLLKNLLINRCSKLKERLAQQSGPNCERSKISHIPEVIIDYVVAPIVRATAIGMGVGTNLDCIGWFCARKEGIEASEYQLLLPVFKFFQGACWILKQVEQLVQVIN